MTGNDMPIVGANPLPFGTARIFERAGDISHNIGSVLTRQGRCGCQICCELETAR